MTPEDPDTVRRAYDAFARGDVTVLHRMRGRGTDSGAEVDLVLGQVVTVENGRLARMHDFQTREEAVAAAAD